MTTTLPHPIEVPDAPAIPGLRFRHAGPDDWALMADLLNRARAGDGIDEVQTGESLRADIALHAYFAIERDVLLAELDGAAVGVLFGYRVPRDGVLVLETWGAVLPEHRGRGIGTALHRATRRRLAAEANEDPRNGPREFRAYALESESAFIGLLATEGYQPIRFGFEMRRFLSGALPEHPLPEGLDLRPVASDQHRSIVDADEEAFRDHWGHREPDEGDYGAWFDHPDTDTSLWCVAWDGDQVAGSSINYVFADENAKLGIRRGWLEHVSVRRPWRGRGVAKALCAASLRVLRDRGMTEAWLGVDAANPTGALGLYEGLGFGVVRKWFAYGRPVDRPAPPGWRSGTGE